jgi:hypothetical protein
MVSSPDMHAGAGHVHIGSLYSCSRSLEIDRHLFDFPRKPERQLVGEIHWRANVHAYV